MSTTSFSFMFHWSFFNSLKSLNFTRPWGLNRYHERKLCFFKQQKNKLLDKIFVKKPWSNSQVLAAVFVIHLQWSSEELEPGTVYIKTTAWTEYDNSFFNNLKTSENNTIYDQIISGLSNSLHYLWPHTHTHTPYLLSVSRCGLWCGWFFREASYCACVSDSSSLLSICITTTAR